jgi:hypothetical protein
MFTIIFMMALLASLSWANDPTVSKVYVVHGIPGTDLGLNAKLAVDVWVDGSLAIPNFKFENVAGPLMFDPGTYNIQIAPAGTTTAVIDADVPLLPNETAVIIAHLTDDGGITASKFVFDVSPTSGHDGRFSFIHAANAPVVDVTGERGGAMPMFRVDEIQNGEKFTVDARPKDWVVKLWPTGVASVVTQTNVKLKKRNYTMLFAVGSLDFQTFTFITIKAKGLK